MFKLKDFTHLPQLDQLITRLTDDSSPGLVLVVGSEAHPAAPTLSSGFFVSSGRNTIFELLYQAYLTKHNHLQASLITHDKAATHLPRALKSRVQVSVAPSHDNYVHRLENAANNQTDVLIVDRMDVENNAATIKLAAQGFKIFTQLDSLVWGSAVLRELDQAADLFDLSKIVSWIVSIQRLPGLCAHCKQPAQISPDQLALLHHRYPWLVDEQTLDHAVFYQPGGCSNCGPSGRSGHIMAFDVYCAGENNLPAGASVLALETYLYHLAASGLIPLDDLVHLHSDHLRRMYNLLQHSRYALHDSDAHLKRKSAELDAANQVLLKRTNALITLQDTLKMLAASNNLGDLAQRVCRKARDVCGADRAILYYLHAGGPHPEAEVLAVAGWDPRLLHLRLPAELLPGGEVESEPTPGINLPIGELPPGVTIESTNLEAGLRVPLICQGQRLGMMILHSTHKRAFSPGEAALLQTFANQAAIAIQRAGLIDELRNRLRDLEAAQAELVQKERLEHELELARQVQQSVLPRQFPEYPGFSFAAANLPARQVGGDFYDVIRLDDQHFGLLIADVSDKGMPAALYMALTRSLLLAEAHRSLSPRIVLQNVNRLLMELGQVDLFVSVFYAVIDCPTRRMVYTRAGHERPILLRSGSAQLLPGQGTVLGILDLEDLLLEEQSLNLQAADRLILLTDGLLDVCNLQGTFFGRERLSGLFSTFSTQSPQELCQTIFDQLQAYQETSSQFDDMTLLVMDVNDNHPCP